MIEKKYQDIKFRANGGGVRAVFLRNYYFDIAKDDLDRIGSQKAAWKLNEKNRSMIIEDKYEKKFDALVSAGFNRLVNIITKRRAFYIHRNSGMPLIGTNYFGIIDRNTNLIEVRPNTGCNLDCIYCSVNEGSAGSGVDYVVEKDYIVEELRRLVAEKGCDDIEIHIGPQGEPLLYAPLEELIADIRKIKEVRRVSIDTNGTILWKEKADSLIKAGITEFNFSINALDEETAARMAGKEYPVRNAVKMLEHISKKEGVRLIIAPVWIPGINDNEIEKLIVLSKELGAEAGIQNYLEYKRGKKPAGVKAMTMEDFYGKLEELEKKHGTKLILSEKDFSIKKVPGPKQVFRKDEVAPVVVMLPGKQKNECLAAARGRLIQVRECGHVMKGWHRQNQEDKQALFPAAGKRIKARITRVKHNIYYAVAM